MILESILSIPLLIYLCRMSGKGKTGIDLSKFWRHILINKFFNRVLVGAVISFLLGANLLLSLYLGVALWVGMSMGWGCPYGAICDGRKMNPDDFECWQFGPFRTNAKYAIVLRSLILALPLALCSFFIPYQICLPMALIAAVGFSIGIICYKPTVVMNKLRESTNAIINKLLPMNRDILQSDGDKAWEGSECFKGLCYGVMIVMFNVFIQI